MSDKQTQKQYFIAAINFLLTKSGRGTQAKLAREIDINPAFLSNIVRGKTLGSVETRKKIADFFGWNLDDIYWFGEWISAGYPPELWEDAVKFAGEVDYSTFLQIDPFADYEQDNHNVNFIIALNYLLKKNGSETIKKLSTKCKIDENCLEQLLRGDFSLLNLSNSDRRKIHKEKIAHFFDLNCNAMHNLGFWLSELYLHNKAPRFHRQPIVINNNTKNNPNQNDYALTTAENRGKYGQPANVDTELLKIIIKNLEDSIMEKGASITADRKAEIIAYMYEELSTLNWDELQATEKTNKLLRMVI